MCLDNKWTEEHKEKWLKDQPKTITAYKVAIERKRAWPALFWRLGFAKYRLASPFFSNNFYKKRNRIRRERDQVRMGDNWMKDPNWYIPYYHLYLNLGSAQSLQAHLILTKECSDVKIAKCKVPKKLITEIGYDCGSDTIVTKGFTIIEEVKD